MNCPAKILVIGNSADDQRAQRNTLSEAELHWEIDFYSSGRAALAKMAKAKPHCIVLDHRLSDMSGLECFALFQALPGNAIPVVMLIPQNDEATVAEALRAGVQDYLFKDGRDNYLALLPAVLKKALREYSLADDDHAERMPAVQVDHRYEHLFLGISDGVILANEQHVIELINPSACRMFGYDACELTGLPLKNIIRSAAEHALQADGLTIFLNAGDDYYASGNLHEARGVRKGGKLFPIELTIASISDDGQRMFAGVMRDITERQQAKETMLESEAHFRGAFDDAPIGMALVSLDGKWLKVNQSLCDILGYTEAELLSTTFQDITHPDDLDIDQTFVQLVLADQLKTYQMETRYFHKDGHIVPVMLSSSLVRSAEGKPLYFISKIEDITQRKKMEDTLFAEKDLAQTALQSIGDAVITTDSNACVTYLNPMAERLTGWFNKEACGLPLDEVLIIINDSTREVIENPVRRALTEGKICSLASNTVLIAKNGMEYYIDNSAAPIRMRDGSLTGAVMVFHDVTEVRTLTRKISFQASHDGLTGLYNRTEFERAAARLLQAAQTAQGTQAAQHSLLFLDLDQFKLVNDTCGHWAGDQLLCQLSHLLLRNTRKSDMLARLGGDEFGLLLEDCPLERAQEIAQHLINTVRAFRFEWKNKLFNVGVSIGIAAITEQSMDIQSVLNDADTACYIAKDKGRNCVHVLESQHEPSLPYARIDWVLRLKNAISQNRFSLYCQEILPLANGSAPHHYEMLLRYHDEYGHVLLPMAFIPAAERYGLLPSIDRWVIQQLFHNPPKSLFDNDTTSFIAINISAPSLADPGFHDFVVHELHMSGIPPARICFEIAESAAITHLHRAIHFIQTLKAFGCHFALDDFGSSLSAFSYLKSLPVDYLKIDGSILKSIAKEPVDYAMVESAHHIAKVMGIKSIAKLVETDEVLQQLRQIGIDYGQGFALHVPESIVFPVKQ